MANFTKIQMSLKKFDTKKLRRLLRKMDYPYQIYSMNDFNEKLMEGKSDDEIIGTLYNRYGWDRKDIEHAYYSAYHVVEDDYDIMASGESFSFVEFCNSAGIEQSDVIDNILYDFKTYQEFFEDVPPAEDRNLVESKLKTMSTFGWYRLINLAYDEQVIKDGIILDRKELQDHLIESYDSAELYEMLTISYPDISKWRYAVVYSEDHEYFKVDNFGYQQFKDYYDLDPIIDFVCEFYNYGTPLFNKKFKDIIENNQKEEI